jgi:transcriptional regulator with GAF, ATPase, and Fis domain
MSDSVHTEAVRRGQPSTSDTGASAGKDELADRLSEFARVLEEQDDVEHTLDAIVHSAVGTVPGAEDASISVVRRRREVMTRAATSELPRAVDHAQYETGQGPCLDTLFEQLTVRVADMPAERRWPEFTLRAAELGVGSMLSLQLYVHGDDLGALNLLSTRSEAFGDESEHVGLLFASHASIAMAGAEQQQQLRSALYTRDLIGQAKGILMERFKVTGDQAFRLLVHVSQAGNRRLTDIAEDLVQSGELPGPAAGARDQHAPQGVGPG